MSTNYIGAQHANDYGVVYWEIAIFESVVSPGAMRGCCGTAMTPTANQLSIPDMPRVISVRADRSNLVEVKREWLPPPTFGGGWGSVCT
jgi:hypothetical protein